VKCSFIYLHAVKGLSALTDTYPQQSLREIMKRYKDTGFDVEYRIRVGEVAMQTIQRSGEAFGKIGTHRSISFTILGIKHCIFMSSR
jgi:hypothetical protein